jgi:Protein of unknown function (DUF3995)
MLRTRDTRWAAYAAFVWAVTYAVGVRFYQASGGRAGLAGTFEDPAGMRRASLVAGIVILVAGVGCLALVRPWGRRIPRPLIVYPALAGAVFTMAHAITAYVTKPLHALGVVHLDFKGWATLDEGALIRWDLLFYEPWFLVFGILVTLGVVHHHRRTGGSERELRRLLGLTGLATVVLSLVACALVL